MAFPGFRYASSGLRAALKVGSRLKPGGLNKELALGVISGAATPVETELEPPVASMAQLQQILSTSFGMPTAFQTKRTLGNYVQAVRLTSPIQSQ